MTRMFMAVGAKAFGGTFRALLLHEFTHRGWLTEQEYLKGLNWAQSLPGPNGVNLAAYLGWRFHGIFGALVAVASFILPGALVVLLMSHLMMSVSQQVVFQATLAAVAAAAIGLLVGVIGKLSSCLKSSTRVGIAAATFALVGILQVFVPLVLLLVLPVAWWLEQSNGGSDEHSA
ncbi:chromate transporter [Oscillatoria sp. CS-180]|nr:chromate transporter [Oscillatoria sp. CS-180]